MKLHDLHPAAGSRRKRTRVGRGIAAGQGKTAGRGTKGQKSRAGASIPAWFEGGQTPIHIRVPKLRGFKNRFKIHYQVVNVGAISEYAAAGRFGVEGAKKDLPVTVNAETLESAGLIGSAEKPVKILGHGDMTEKVFVAADLFSASARKKIEDAGGFVQVLAPEKPAPPEKAEKPERPTRPTRPEACSGRRRAAAGRRRQRCARVGRLSHARRWPSSLRPRPTPRNWPRLPNRHLPKSRPRQPSHLAASPRRRRARNSLSFGSTLPVSTHGLTAAKRRRVATTHVQPTLGLGRATTSRSIKWISWGYDASRAAQRRTGEVR